MYLGQFWDYHDMNPHVFQAHLVVATRWQREGRERIAVAHITQHLRWNTPIKTHDEESGLKLRNQLQPYYARMLIFVRPSLGTMIVVKRLGMPHRPRTEPTVYKHDPLRGKRIAHLWMTGLWPEEDDPCESQ